MKNILFSFLASALFVACSNEKPVVQAAPEAAENTVELTGEQLKIANLGLGKAENRPIMANLRVNGRVDVPPHNLVSVSFPLGGYLKTSEMLEGMPVKKGQVIAVIEDPAFVQVQQDFLTAQAKMEFLETELARQTELSKEQVNAGKMLQQVQSDHRMQRILVKSLAEKLRFIGLLPENLTPENITRTVNLRSPITGFVSKINVNPGKYLAPTDVLFELVNPDDIHAELTVFEKDMPKIAIGQSVNITVPSVPGLAYRAKIILISRTLDSARSARVHCHFDKEDHRLSPGMFLEADIEMTEKDAFSVPDEAIVRFENRFFVFISKNERSFELVEVRPGASDGKFTAIEPVDSATELAGQNFVVKNAHTLLGKMKNAAEE